MAESYSVSAGGAGGGGGGGGGGGSTRSESHSPDVTRALHKLAKVLGCEEEVVEKKGDENCVEELARLLYREASQQPERHGAGGEGGHAGGGGGEVTSSNPTLAAMAEAASKLAAFQRQTSASVEHPRYESPPPVPVGCFKSAESLS